MAQIRPHFSEYIHAWRMENNLTQEQAAELLNTSTRCFQTWEHGICLPDFPHVLILVHVAHFDISAFAEDIFSEELSSDDDDDP